jgi:dolichol kinase
MPFKSRNQIHFARRLWHFSGVIVIFTLYAIVTPSQAPFVVIPFAVFMIGFDWLRLRRPALNRFFQWMFRPFIREDERHKLAASTAMMAGVTLIICIFPRNVVLLTLLFLALGDPAASYFGIKYGKDKLIGGKTLQGTLGAFGVCFLLAALFFTKMDLMTDRLFIVCLLAGLIGAVSELVPIWKLDDNFVFPVTSATLLTGLFYVFGGLG